MYVHDLMYANRDTCSLLGGFPFDMERALSQSIQLEFGLRAHRGFPEPSSRVVWEISTTIHVSSWIIVRLPLPLVSNTHRLSLSSSPQSLCAAITVV